MSKKIAVVVGSIRQNSYSQQLAQNLIALLPEGYQAEFVQIDHLPPSTIRTMTAPNPPLPNTPLFVIRYVLLMPSSLLPPRA